jgi:flagellar basal body-associated protein FliL
MRKKSIIVAGVAVVLVLLAVVAIYYWMGTPSRQAGTEKVAVSKADSRPVPATEHQGHAPGSMMAPEGQPKKPEEAPTETPGRNSRKKQQLIGEKWLLSRAARTR